jgi:hydroxymethylpyrimidine kinase/phosphomethylpyrimidine kinase
LRRAAAVLHQRRARNVVITSGDFEPVPGKAIDVLSTAGGGQMEEFAALKVASRSTHGTGCAFSTAVAANLALGRSLPEAVSRAKQFVREAIRTAAPMGSGIGPLNHFPTS